MTPSYGVQGWCSDAGVSHNSKGLYLRLAARASKEKPVQNTLSPPTEFNT